MSSETCQDVVRDTVVHWLSCRDLLVIDTACTLTDIINLRALGLSMGNAFSRSY